MPKRLVTGVVTRDKAAKTRRVEIARLVRHPMYGKTLRLRTVYVSLADPDGFVAALTPRLVPPTDVGSSALPS